MTWTRRFAISTFAPDTSHQAIRAHIITMGGWIKDHDVVALTRHCAIPFIAYVQNDIYVMDNSRHLKALWGSHCDTLSADGAFDAKVKFISHTVLDGLRHAVVVNWRLQYCARQKTLDVTTRYMFRTDAGCREIMLELLEDVTDGETDLSTILQRHYGKILRN